MATGQDLVNTACRFLGEPYSTAPGRDDPFSGFKDCSGLISATYLVATGATLGANVSVTIFDLCARQGLAISREEAFATPGACLLMPEDPYLGWGPNGHIGFSDGNGGTVEATPPRVQRLPNTYQPWGSNACLLPGIVYGLPETPHNPTWSDEMIYVYNDDSGQRRAIAMQGNVIVGDWTGNVGAFNIPQGALDWSANQIPIREVPSLLVAKLRKADSLACS